MTDHVDIPGGFIPPVVVAVGKVGQELDNLIFFTRKVSSPAVLTSSPSKTVSYAMVPLGWGSPWAVKPGFWVMAYISKLCLASKEKRGVHS